MTEFKGKNEGIRSSRAAVGILETGGGSPAGKKIGASAPSQVCSDMEIPYSRSSFPIGGLLF